MVTALRVEHLHFRYPDGTQALADVSFRVEEGERWGIAGANGCGKSTLLHHVAGVYPAEGHIEVFGRTASRANLKWIRTQVGLLFQNPEDQLFMPTVREDVAFGPIEAGLPREEVERRVEAALLRVGLADKAARPPHHLSGGEKRAAALAAILAMEPRVLALDEPTNDLDPCGRREFIRFLKEWEGTVLVATHDLELILEAATHILILHEGRTAEVGDPRSVLADGERLERYRLEVPPSLRGAPI